MADQLNSLLGSGISLISQEDIRYDGILFSINAMESKIILSHVRNFGTEDRVLEKSRKLAGTTTIQDYVTFMSTDIKDLFVHETSAEAAPQVVAPTTSVPTISAQATPKMQQQQAPRQNNVGRSQQGRGRNVEQSQGDSNQSRARREPQAQSGPAAGTGEHLLKLRVKKGAEGGSTDNFVVSGEFDFEAGLGNFNKNEVLAKVAAERVIDEDSKYKKDDFFDSLSNDAVNRAAEGLQPRRSQAEERNLNQDTFGAIALQSNNYRRGGYRGGGRGGGRNYEGGGGDGRGRGRGQGRGRGRGGSNSTAI